jgi:hypothetical protein
MGAEVTYRQPNLRASKVINRELKPFLGASGAHQRAVRRSLVRLGSASASVNKAFQSRRDSREQADSAREKRDLTAAIAALTAQTKLHKRNLSLGDKEASRISKLYLEIAEGTVETVKVSARWHRAVSGQADLIDAKLQAWLDELVVLSASAVSDDTSVEKALALASGGLIIAGTLGGPATALGATAASAVLLARDVAKGATKAGRAKARDEAELRELRAVDLMDHISQLCERWKAVL